ncbi:MAG TPA: GNAT family N-acetyltransferase [Anaerolineaceae bacterium]|nr:GNAT family N-acetyltransferase [Anaerolineaceae bacterium]
MEKDKKDLFTIPGFTTRYLHPGDEALIFDLDQRCEDFSLLVSGLPPTEEEAAAVLVDLPPGKSPADKFVIGAFAGPEKMIGLVDMIRGYPEAEDWFIGLMQLDPAYRGQGTGGQLYRAVAGWCRQRGARAILLGVVEQNTRGLAFWEKMGFHVIEKRPPRRFGIKDCVVLVMKKAL